MNVPKLRGKMAEKNVTRESLAKVLNINIATLHRKLTGKSKFTTDEAKKIANILELEEDEIISIFFKD